MKWLSFHVARFFSHSKTPTSVSFLITISLVCDLKQPFFVIVSQLVVSFLIRHHQIKIINKKLYANACADDDLFVIVIEWISICQHLVDVNNKFESFFSSLKIQKIILKNFVVCNFNCWLCNAKNEVAFANQIVQIFFFPHLFAPNEQKNLHETVKKM